MCVWLSGTKGACLSLSIYDQSISTSLHTTVKYGVVITRFRLLNS